jgi:hypothetical protein
MFARGRSKREGGSEELMPYSIFKKSVCKNISFDNLAFGNLIFFT